MSSPAALAALVRRSRLIAVVVTALSVGVYFWAARGRWELPDGAARRCGYLVLLGVPIVLAVVHQVLFRRLGWRSRNPPATFLLGRRKGRPVWLTARPQVPHGAALIIAVGVLLAARVGNIWVGTLRPRLIGWDAIAPPGPQTPGHADRFLRVPTTAVVPVESAAPEDSPPHVSPRTWDRLHGSGLDYDSAL